MTGPNRVTTRVTFIHDPARNCGKRAESIPDKKVGGISGRESRSLENKTHPIQGGTVFP